MKRNIILSAAIASIIAANSAYAIDTSADTVTIYGKMHVSVDLSDKDDGSANSDGMSISSNSSRLGFKGDHAVNDDTSIIWKLETEIKPDEASGNLLSRNSYVGLKGEFGSVKVGHMDTPFKLVGSVWGVFGDTVGERRAILGASATNGNKLNQRAKNSLLYTNKFGNVTLSAMYATDAQDSAAGKLDDTDNDMTSISVTYKEGPLMLAIAQENWSMLETYDKVDGLRAAASYKLSDAKVGAIYESTSGTTAISDQWSRDVMGVNATYKMDALTFKAQYLQADDYDGVADSGATKSAVGVFNKLDKQTQVYLAYAVTSNDANAKFQAVDGGHGDEVKTVLGGSPTALSAGLIYKF